MELSEKDEEYIISLIKQGKKVDAIVFVKDKTGMSFNNNRIRAIKGRREPF